MYVSAVPTCLICCFEAPRGAIEAALEHHAHILVVLCRHMAADRAATAAMIQRSLYYVVSFLFSGDRSRSGALRAHPGGAAATHYRRSRRGGGGLPACLGPAAAAAGAPQRGGRSAAGADRAGSAAASRCRPPAERRRLFVRCRNLFVSPTHRHFQTNMAMQTVQLRHHSSSAL